MTCYIDAPERCFGMVGDPGTPPPTTGKASSRAVADNFSIFQMLHHSLSFDPL